MLTNNTPSPLASVRRGDIFYADLSPVIGSEQGGLRPVLIIQNDVGNKYSPTVIAAAITSRMGKTKLPTHIDIYADRVGLAKDSVILLEQIRTLDKKRLREKMGHLDDDVMEEVNNAIAVSFGLHEGIREATPARESVHESSGSRIVHSPIPEPRVRRSSTVTSTPEENIPDVTPAAAVSDSSSATSSADLPPTSTDGTAQG